MSAYLSLPHLWLSSHCHRSCWMSAAVQRSEQAHRPSPLCVQQLGYLSHCSTHWLCYSLWGGKEKSVFKAANGWAVKKVTERLWGKAPFHQEQICAQQVQQLPAEGGQATQKCPDLHMLAPKWTHTQNPPSVLNQDEKREEEVENNSNERAAVSPVSPL